MKSMLALSVLCLVSASARAAITVTISEGISGTRFTIQQTSENPVFSTDFVTVGEVGAFTLSAQSVQQVPLLYTVEVPISPSPGTLTKVAGNSASVSNLSFVYSLVANGMVPVLGLDGVLAVPPNGTHQFIFSGGVTGEADLDFSYFVPGTYTESSPIFGTITTVVIPEPGSLLLAAAGVCAVVVRRRK